MLTKILTTAALIAIGVLLFEFIVFFHEFGHFITAKKFGVQVNEFAIGMGPKLFSFKRGETVYSLRLLPIGGYCALEGENEESDNARAFINKPVWQRMIVIVAGAFNNIVLGLIMMAILLVQSPAFSSTTVSGFAQSAFTSKSGLQVGDVLTKIGDYKITNSRDISFAVAMLKMQIVDGQDFSIYKEDCGFDLVRQYSSLEAKDYTDEELAAISKAFNEGIEKLNNAASKEEANSITDETMNAVNELSGKNYTPEEREYMPERKRFRTDVTVLRGGAELTLSDVDFYTYLGDNGEPAVAIDFSVEPIEKTFLSTVRESFSSTYSVVRMIWKSLFGLVTGTYGMNDMAGPVGAASVVTQAAAAGLETGFIDAVDNILYMMMIITVNLGIVNLLPLPALDGGRFFFMVIEVIMRKPVPAKYEGWVHAAGFAILLGFIAVITLNDIIRIVTGAGFGG
ncbi:MAG: RIP metalloprotease RseP [Clostridia bacterium]|nr:RIP metalloprotease RseP [Clostridia bacterium]